MPSPKVSIWKDAPELAIPDVPALICDSNNLWLCYAVAHSAPKSHAIIQFTEVIDHRLSPINDEGLGKHPYCKAGLQFYAFNEIVDSKETIEWSVPNVLIARHWIITFKDNTLDVIARGARIVAKDLHTNSPTAGLFKFFSVEQI
jgi:hypothetical protein